MKGKPYYASDRNRWRVGWWDEKAKKWRLIDKYNGNYMPCTAFKMNAGQILLNEKNKPIPDKDKCQGYKLALKLLALIQGRWEQANRGECTFRIEEFTKRDWTDVIPYFKKWLGTKEKKKPATYKGYKSYFKNWIKPFFESYPVQIHEIQLDTLDKLLDSLKLSGKGKHNVMMCFHAFLDYAWRSKRIFEIPPFPKKEDYEIVQPTITWLPSDRQIAIIKEIPEIHQPIFWFLKYHLRRPAEACALHKCDYDLINKVFTIRRSISARKLINSTKTNKEHIIPCHSNMVPLIDYLAQQSGDFMFQNSRARKNGKRYTNESLNIIWKTACKTLGEDIDLYSGLKHSSCSQFINEQGMALSDLQTITDHARLDSVERYAKTEVARKRELMEAGSVKLSGLLRLVK
jgi:integrase